ncbi:hypothetical protein GCM10027597_31230 [Saccharopolyspora tripterygii]
MGTDTRNPDTGRTCSTTLPTGLPSTHGLPMTTPDDWLSDYNAKLQQIKTDTDRAQDELTQVGASALP